VDHNDTPGTGSDVAGSSSSARAIAIVAIIVALTAPFWEEPILASINIHLPLHSELARTAAAVDQQDRRTAELEQQLAVASAQLGKLQATLTQTTSRANAAADWVGMVAMADLAVALRRPGGFELELATLRAATPNPGELKPLLDQIEPYAVTGVPSTAQLRQDFARFSSRIAWAQRGYASVAWVGHLIPWSRSVAAAPPQTDTTAQLLSQANAQLASGDLAGAVGTVQQVDASHQEVLADWVEDATARVAADAVVQRLSDQIAQRAGTTKPVKPQ
jgi:hypothetical protein